jgi:hypothetical protein
LIAGLLAIFRARVLEVMCACILASKCVCVQSSSVANLIPCRRACVYGRIYAHVVGFIRT